MKTSLKNILVMLQYFGGMQRNEKKEKVGNGKNIRNALERLSGLGLQTNSSIPFLKAAAMIMSAVFFSILVTVRQH